MIGYDAWLEASYQRAAAENDAYVEWCEENDLDPNDDHGDDFRQAMEDAREDAMIDAAERRADAERDDWDY